MWLYLLDLPENEAVLPSRARISRLDIADIFVSINYSQISSYRYLTYLANPKKEIEKEL